MPRVYSTCTRLLTLQANSAKRLLDILDTFLVQLGVSFKCLYAVGLNPKVPSNHVGGSRVPNGRTLLQTTTMLHPRLTSRVPAGSGDGLSELAANGKTVDAVAGVASLWDGS